jgi:hypothetical protein
MQVGRQKVEQERIQNSRLNIQQNQGTNSRRRIQNSTGQQNQGTDSIFNMHRADSNNTKIIKGEKDVQVF